MKKSINGIFVFLFLFVHTSILPMGASTYELKDPYLKQITLKDWISKKYFSYDTLLKIFKEFNCMACTWLTSDNIWYGENFSSDILNVYNNFEGLHTQRNHEESVSPFLPMVAKWVVPGYSEVIIIGDTHAKKETVDKLLLNLNSKELSLLDENLIFSDKIRFVSLGDNLDRGGDSLYSFATFLLLSLKNSGKCLFLRGNHEDIDSNVSDHGLALEIVPLTENDSSVSRMLHEIGLCYEFLPACALIGFCDDYDEKNPTKFQVLTHGGLDPRIVLTDYSTYKAEDFAKDGGIKMWKLLPDDLLNYSDLNEILFTMISEKQLANLGLESLITEFMATDNLVKGYMWNDVSFDLKDEILDNGVRGEGILSFRIDLIAKFLNYYSSEYAQFIGLIKGHDHGIPKKLVNGNWAEQIGQKTSGAAFFSIKDNSLSSLLLDDQQEVRWSDGSNTIVNLISGDIEYPNYPTVKYCSTFINLKYDSIKKTHILKAFCKI